MCCKKTFSLATENYFGIPFYERQVISSYFMNQDKPPYPTPLSRIVHIITIQDIAEQWLNGEDISQYIEDPNYEKAVIEAGAEFVSEPIRNAWLRDLIGDGSNETRNKLAEKTLQLISSRNYG